MSRYRLETGGELWWVGYDEASVSYFADRDNDLDRDDYDAPCLPRFADLEEAIAGRLVLPGEMRGQLAAEEPVRVDTAEARASARMDQLAAELRDGYAQAIDPELQRIIDVNRRNFPTHAANWKRPADARSSEGSGYQPPRQERNADQGLDR